MPHSRGLFAAWPSLTTMMAVVAVMKLVKAVQGVSVRMEINLSSVWPTHVESLVWDSGWAWRLCLNGAGLAETKVRGGPGVVCRNGRRRELVLDPLPAATFVREEADVEEKREAGHDEREDKMATGSAFPKPSVGR